MNSAIAATNPSRLIPSDLSDAEFVRAFEALTIPNDSFHHRDHIRFAWIYVREFGLSVAQEKIASAIRAFAAHHGKSEKYHHTITLAWTHLVAAAFAETPNIANFDEFIVLHPDLLDPSALSHFYSAPLLASPPARAGWVEPDLAPLPWSPSTTL